MLCQKCGLLPACCIVTSCDGVQCYELHLCLACKEGRGGPPTPEQQQSLVSSAMKAAEAEGLDEESVARALGLDPEEIRRVLNGEGVSDPSVWDAISAHLVVK